MALKLPLFEKFVSPQCERVCGGPLTITELQENICYLTHQNSERFKVTQYLQDLIQQYLRKSKAGNKISEKVYKRICPKNARLAR